jgi:hypothetical protein
MRLVWASSCIVRKAGTSDSTHRHPVLAPQRRQWLHDRIIRAEARIGLANDPSLDYTAGGACAGWLGRGVDLSGACPIVAAMSSVRRALCRPSAAPGRRKRRASTISRTRWRTSSSRAPASPFRVGLSFDAFEPPVLRRARPRAPVTGVRGDDIGERSAAPRGLRCRRRPRPARPLRPGGPASGHGGPGRRQACPYAHELWLPLLWIFVGAEG